MNRYITVIVSNAIKTTIYECKININILTAWHSNTNICKYTIGI
jgi:hypothetical protein